VQGKGAGEAKSSNFVLKTASASPRALANGESMPSKTPRTPATKCAGHEIARPINRDIPKNVGKGPQGKGSGDARGPNSSLPGNKSPINDVRNGLGAEGSEERSAAAGPFGRASMPPNAKTMQKNAFQERLKAGDLNRLTIRRSREETEARRAVSHVSEGDVARHWDCRAWSPSGHVPWRG